MKSVMDGKNWIVRAFLSRLPGHVTQRGNNGPVTWGCRFSFFLSDFFSSFFALTRKTWPAGMASMARARMMGVLDGIRSSSSLTLSTVLPHSNYASGQPMARGSYCFFIVRSVEEKTQTVFSRTASTPPWCSSRSNGRTIFMTDISIDFF